MIWFRAYVRFRVWMSRFYLKLSCARVSSIGPSTPEPFEATPLFKALRKGSGNLVHSSNMGLKLPLLLATLKPKPHL